MNAEEHLVNILKILSTDDHDEMVAHSLYVYVCGWKLIDLGIHVNAEQYVDEVKSTLERAKVEREAEGSEFAFRAPQRPPEVAPNVQLAWMYPKPERREE